MPRETIKTLKKRISDLQKLAVKKHDIINSQNERINGMEKAIDDCSNSCSRKDDEISELRQEGASFCEEVNEARKGVEEIINDIIQFIRQNQIRLNPNLDVTTLAKMQGRIEAYIFVGKMLWKLFDRIKPNHTEARQHILVEPPPEVWFRVLDGQF